MKTNRSQKLLVALLSLAQTEACFGQADPASKPHRRLAVAKSFARGGEILIPTRGSRTVRDPTERFLRAILRP